MRIFDATIDDKEINEIHDVTLIVLETDRERKLYYEEEYSTLLQNTDYVDSDIFYYIDVDDIPKKNRGDLVAGDVYDFFSIVRAVAV